MTLSHTAVAHKLSPENMVCEMQRRLSPLAEDPDAWVRRMMRWHFSAETGSAFWLKRQHLLNFDPLTDVRGWRDLPRFGLFDKDVLRHAPLSELVPRGFADRPRRVFETGGTTGPPCRIVDVTTGQYNVVMYRVMLEARGLAGGDVVGMTPSGPHAYGTFVARLTDTWRGQAHFIDLDPRYVKCLLRAGESVEPYIGHLIAQTRVLLESQQPSLLFTTSRLLMSLVLELPRPLSEYGVRAVCTGGTSCTAEEIRYLTDRYLGPVQWIDTYGNTLMGHALQGDPWREWPHRAYYLPAPLARIQVVSPDDWRTEVDYGERGRVLVTTVLEDLFIPNLLERDSAIRVGPHPWYPWDGVSHIEVYPENPASVIEGVY